MKSMGSGPVSYGLSFEVSSSLVDFFREFLATGIACRDVSGTLIYEVDGHASLCRKLAERDDTCGQCEAGFHMDILRKAADTDEVILEACPYGLVFFCIPLKVFNEPLGFLTGGPLITALSYSGRPKMAKLIAGFADIGRDLSLDYLDIPIYEEFHLRESISKFINFVRFFLQDMYRKLLEVQSHRMHSFVTEISHLVDANLNLEDLLDVISRKAAEAMGVDECAILLHNPGHREWISSKKPSAGKGSAARMDEVSAHVVSTGRRYVAADAESDPLLRKGPPEGIAAKSLLSVPVFIGRKAVGVLHLATFHIRHRFTQAEIDLAEAVAGETALALEGTRLYEESQRKANEAERARREMQSYFVRIGTALSSALNLNDLLNLIVELSVKITRADAGSLYLIEERNMVTEVTFGSLGKSREMLGLRMRESLLGWSDSHLAEAGSPEVTVAPEIVSPGDASGLTVSYLGVPLFTKEEVKGLLNIYIRGRRNFAVEEVEILTAFAGQAALAIENAQIFEFEQRRAREATLLYKAARSIGQSTKVDEILTISAQELCRIAEVNRCIIFHLDARSQEMYARHFEGVSEDQMQCFSSFRMTVSGLGQPAWEKLKQGLYMHLHSAPEESPGIRYVFDLLPSNSCLVVPLLAKGELIGFIYLDDSTGAHYFSQSQIRLVMTLSIQIATAYQRASLVKQKGENLEHLRALYQVSTALAGTLSLPRVCNLIVEKTVELLGIPCCCLLIWDDLDKTFSLQSCFGLPPGFSETEFQSCIAGPAVDKRRPILFYLSKEGKDIAVDLLLRNNNLGGTLSIPLVAKKKLLGVINCFVAQDDHITQSGMRLMKSFANQAAVAIERAHLHSEMKNKVRELATLFEVGKAITSTLDFELVLQAIAANVKSALQADGCSIMLLDSAGEILSIRTAMGLGKHCFGKKIRLGRGVAGIAAKTGRPMVLVDAKNEEAELKFPASVRRDGMKTLLSVPMFAKGRIIGLVNLYLKTVYYPSHAEMSLLTTLAGQAAIAIENARLYDEKLYISLLLKNMLMPEEKLRFPGLQIGHRYLASEELSGDYFDVIPIDERRVVFTIADVSGKGPGAAIYAARTKYILRAFAACRYKPCEVLKITNQLMGKETEGDKFLTLFYLEADLDRREIVYSAAGHEPPIFWDSRKGEVRLLEQEGMLIGVEPDVDFGESRMEVSPGDFVLFYTDGVMDARSPSGEFFGTGRLKDLVKEYSYLSPQTLVNKLFAVISRFTNRRLRDDVTMMVVRF
jgi:sigma-B regulation protein RsbU (phosphoserine phosphatase)